MALFNEKERERDEEIEENKGQVCERMRRRDKQLPHTVIKDRGKEFVCLETILLNLSGCAVQL